MNDDIDPEKSWNTLVAHVAVLQVDNIISKLKELRSQGASPEDLHQHLATHFADVDASSKEKILNLAMGNVPPDDFSREEIEKFDEESERTLQFTLKEATDRFAPGMLVFFGGTRWVVTSAQEQELILKKV